MSPALPSPRRTVALRMPGTTLAARMDAANVEAMLVRAQAMGLSPQLDPQIAVVLAAVRLRNDVPEKLYAALASVMGALYGAAEGA
jgi:flagellar biosynthesis protein